jgi:hypothetical protein
VQAVADTFVIGDIPVRRLGFGAMRLTVAGRGANAAIDLTRNVSSGERSSSA